MQKIRSRYETIALRETVSSINFAYRIDELETRQESMPSVRVDSKSKKNLPAYIISTWKEREREKNEYYFFNKKIFICRYIKYFVYLKISNEHFNINDNNVILLIVKRVKFI